MEAFFFQTLKIVSVIPTVTDRKILRKSIAYSQVHSLESEFQTNQKNQALKT